MRYLIYFLFLALCHHATYAQKIYKWTDEHGKTHYGDKPAAKGANKVTIMNKKKSQAPAASKPSIDEQEPLDEQAIIASEKNVPKCLAIARKVAAQDYMASTSRTHSERKNLLKELQFFCPNKVYECISYKVNPDEIICKASTRENRGDNFFKHSMLGTGKPSKSKPAKKQRQSEDIMI